MNIILTNMTHVNGYKFDKYNFNKLVIVVDKITILNGYNN